jgi:23S rRNA-intervening sequence protein
VSFFKGKSRKAKGKMKSVGANYREACRGRSKAEFVSKCGDSLRELEESAYWLELLVDAGIVGSDKLSCLRQRGQRVNRNFRDNHQSRERQMTFAFCLFLPSAFSPLSS